MPSDPQKAALVDQFLSVEYSYFGGLVYKMNAQEIYIKYRGGTTNPEIVKEIHKELDNIFDIYEKILDGKD